MIKKIAVANRGEIAKRIIVTCREMGLQSVLLYASGDMYNEAFRQATEHVCIGPSDPTKSYLDIEKNIQAALGSKACAIHPGYGFLSENSEFAKECEKKSLIFIGPHSSNLELLGNKISAKQKAKQAGIQVLPSWSGDMSDKDLIIKQAKNIGYPVMIKAAMGGGGRGLRYVFSHKDLIEQLSIVRSEALQSFKSSKVFLEKYLENAKHIELQIFVSADQDVHILGDRDCSSQRRHQKIIEEAPSQLDESIKQKMKQACQNLCSILKYQGAGTIEFLVYKNDFYFLEMNTRLQVEHTVTEMIYGVDLVRAQILTAMKQPAFFKNTDFKTRGHSIQCRVCAEDPDQNFLPSAGKLLSCHWPQGRAVRVDTAYQTGDQISPFYDSLIGKIIVWDQSRVRAIEKMKQALENTRIFGILSNLPFLHFILSHPLFVENKISTTDLEKIYKSEWTTSKCPVPKELLQDIFQKGLVPVTSSDNKTFNPWTGFNNKKT